MISPWKYKRSVKSTGETRTYGCNRKGSGFLKPRRFFFRGDMFKKDERNQVWGDELIRKRSGQKRKKKRVTNTTIVRGGPGWQLNIEQVGTEASFAMLETGFKR